MTYDRKLLIISLLFSITLMAEIIQLGRRNHDLQVYIDSGCRGRYQGTE